jgi:hypothetical protein
MAVRENLIQAIADLFGAERAPQVYDFDNLPQAGVYDEDTEEAELQVYGSYFISMPITIEKIDFYQDSGAAADPYARNLARAQAGNALHRELITTVLQNVANLGGVTGFRRVHYANGGPVYFTEDSNFVAATATFVIVYEDDYSS